MANSILQSRRECYVCRRLYNVVTTRGLEKHHILGGPLRPASERYGLKVYLCGPHHREQNGYSAHFDPALQRWLKRRAQTAFEDLHGHRAWMEVFGKDYLETTERKEDPR